MNFEVHTEENGGHVSYEGDDPYEAFGTIRIGTPMSWLSIRINGVDWSIGNECVHRENFVARVNYIKEMHEAFYGE